MLHHSHEGEVRYARAQAMTIQLVEGVVSAVDRSPARISFRVGEHLLQAPPAPEALTMKSGQFVHVLSCTDWESDVEDVLVLKFGGGDPVYCGPSLGWPFLALGGGVFILAIASSTFWLLVVPVLLGLIHCDLLARRARVYARFANELSCRLARAIHEPSPSGVTSTLVLEHSVHDE
jgi:hypothetical protein